MQAFACKGMNFKSVYKVCNFKLRLGVNLNYYFIKGCPIIVKDLVSKTLFLLFYASKSSLLCT
jgi:hypothetical protein